MSDPRLKSEGNTSNEAEPPSLRWSAASTFYNSSHEDRENIPPTSPFEPPELTRSPAIQDDFGQYGRDDRNERIIKQEPKGDDNGYVYTFHPNSYVSTPIERQPLPSVLSDEIEFQDYMLGSMDDNGLKRRLRSDWYGEDAAKLEGSTFRFTPEDLREAAAARHGFDQTFHEYMMSIGAVEDTREREGEREGDGTLTEKQRAEIAEPSIIARFALAEMNERRGLLESSLSFSSPSSSSSSSESSSESSDGSSSNSNDDQDDTGEPSGDGARPESGSESLSKGSSDRDKSSKSSSRPSEKLPGSSDSGNRADDEDGIPSPDGAKIIPSIELQSSTSQSSLKRKASDGRSEIPIPQSPKQENSDEAAEQQLMSQLMHHIHLDTTSEQRRQEQERRQREQQQQQEEQRRRPGCLIQPPVLAWVQNILNRETEQQGQQPQGQQQQQHESQATTQGGPPPIPPWLMQLPTQEEVRRTRDERRAQQRQQQYEIYLDAMQLPGSPLPPFQEYIDFMDSLGHARSPELTYQEYIKYLDIMAAEESQESSFETTTHGRRYPHDLWPEQVSPTPIRPPKRKGLSLGEGGDDGAPPKRSRTGALAPVATGVSALGQGLERPPLKEEGGQVRDQSRRRRRGSSLEAIKEEEDQGASPTKRARTGGEEPGHPSEQQPREGAGEQPGQHWVQNDLGQREEQWRQHQEQQSQQQPGRQPGQAPGQVPVRQLLPSIEFPDEPESLRRAHAEREGTVQASPIFTNERTMEMVRGVSYQPPDDQGRWNVPRDLANQARNTDAARIFRRQHEEHQETLAGPRRQSIRALLEEGEETEIEESSEERESANRSSSERSLPQQSRRGRDPRPVPPTTVWSLVPSKPRLGGVTAAAGVPPSTPPSQRGRLGSSVFGSEESRSAEKLDSSPPLISGGPRPSPASVQSEGPGPGPGLVPGPDPAPASAQPQPDPAATPATPAPVVAYRDPVANPASSRAVSDPPFATHTGGTPSPLRPFSAPPTAQYTEPAQPPAQPPTSNQPQRRRSTRQIRQTSMARESEAQAEYGRRRSQASSGQIQTGGGRRQTQSRSKAGKTKTQTNAGVRKPKTQTGAGTKKNGGQTRAIPAGRRTTGGTTTRTRRPNTRTQSNTQPPQPQQQPQQQTQQTQAGASGSRNKMRSGRISKKPQRLGFE
ncbi:hypothetical protein TSTA_103050 [Talaromyces stipitatus ATCC 10500]|uniref:Uncharacterized protein n=1 Tax=Talaromyces stipitatus (strain ATCC 10500 / CBS 375.48 / QM 6759 / NRRL 1006) TaxID=441959 RepID=B8MNI9_TALSN|nr:uncharacterized protein TSTA_103050 [Talaromyces stipitatus ATCC 10500]EED14078.1 hypothetical protein TSTA_103050 [Talaromyces stipitatus ATCC 10500]